MPPPNSDRASQMQIRDIGEAELNAVLALYAHLHSQDEPPPSDEAAQQAWREAMSNPRCRYIGGYENQVLISSCTITAIPNLTRGCRPYAVIENVVTHKDHRNKGWGKAVLGRALQFAWAQGCYKVVLLTGRNEEAIFKFYEAAGFSRHGKHAFIARPEA
jgi:GNAT superfamily N-acetyltransferase